MTIIIFAVFDKKLYLLLVPLFHFWYTPLFSLLDCEALKVVYVIFKARKHIDNVFDSQRSKRKMTNISKDCQLLWEEERGIKKTRMKLKITILWIFLNVYDVFIGHTDRKSWEEK